jgi:hypothetical protein
MERDLSDTGGENERNLCDVGQVLLDKGSLDGCP